MRQLALAAGLIGQALLLVIWLGSDNPAGPEERLLPEPGGTLTVLTIPGVTTYKTDRSGEPSGPEVELIALFAASNNWEVRWEVADSREDLLNRLRDNEADIAAAGLTLTDSRKTEFLLGKPHTLVSEQVACHFRLSPFPRKPKDLAGVELEVEAASTFVETLRKLEAKHKLKIALNSRGDVLAEELMKEVADQEADCLIADSNQIKAMRRVYPDLKVAMNVATKRDLGWYFPLGAQEMQKAANTWLDSKQGKRALAQVRRNYFDYIADFDFVEMQVLNRRIKERLPKYKKLFLKAEQETGLPADLLAAVAYQESHWNPKAMSATGVRGIMMLTQRTASSLGVKNRLDPRASIAGGARYLKDRYDRQPPGISDPDRLFFALASYNVGHAHLQDARKLARKLGRNPDSWADMREVLPLKADKRYYRKMRYGYARGYEPVKYVRRIRNYRDVIQTAFLD